MKLKRLKEGDNNMSDNIKNFEEAVEEAVEVTTEQEVVEENEDLTMDDIKEALHDHKLNIEKIYKELKEETEKPLIDINGNDIVGIVKWLTIGVIGVTVAKNSGGFALDIPFFHIRFGNINK